MQFQKIDNSYIVHVEKGEKVMDTLTQFCIDRDITSGQLSGIGAVRMLISEHIILLQKNIFIRFLIRYLNYFHFKVM